MSLYIFWNVTFVGPLPSGDDKSRRTGNQETFDVNQILIVFGMRDTIETIPDYRISYALLNTQKICRHVHTHMYVCVQLFLFFANDFKVH